MDLRLALYELGAEHRLDLRATQRLERLAGLRGEPATLMRWFPAVIGVLAAMLFGLGLVFWIAANWDTLGRLLRFALIEGVVVVMCLGAWLRPAARTPLGLIALLGIGGLFAYFGQTYQTGADAWQLFALWAVLALPLCWSVRSDVLWAPWALVAMTTISLWVYTHTGHQWRVEPQDLLVHAMGWAAAFALVGACSAPVQRWSGAGVWALRTALTLAVVMVTLTAIGALFHKTIAVHYWLGLGVFGAALAFLAQPKGFDIYGLSAAALGLNTLLVVGLAWSLLSKHSGGDPIGELLLVGLFAAGLLAATVATLVRLARRDAPASGAHPENHAMSSERLLAVMRAAIAQRILPAGATPPEQDGHPWPVVLLTGLGAWLAAVPLLGAIGTLFGDWISRSAGLYFVGVLLLAGAIVVLRSCRVPLFVDQLAIPALLAGGGALGLGLMRDLNSQVAWLMLGLVAIVLAAAIAKPWLRVLLGAAAAGAIALAWMPAQWDVTRAAVLERFWLAWHLNVVLWLVALAVQSRLAGAGGARHAQTLEPVSAGWLLATLAGLAWWSGMTFLVGGSLGGGFAGEVGRELGQRSALGVPWLQAGSALLALMAAAWTALQWPTLRRPLPGAVALVLAALCSFMPVLGVTLVALAVCATSARWRLAATAALTAAWIVGAFYYQLDWPLATKALVLMAAGGLFGVLARFEHRASHSSPAAGASSATSTRTIVGSSLGIGTTALAVLFVANFAIWQKEELIATGQSVYVELAPVDPRSMMQGDFMRLNFRIPGDPRGKDGLLTTRRPHVIAKREANGVAVLLRVDEGQPLGPDELRIELTPKDGRWTLVTDSWFFAEGEAKRWERARYGEFRVEPGGRALLVGLRGANLDAL